MELLDLDPTAESSEEGANIDLDATRVGKSAVIKTSTRQTIFLPLIGLVDSDQLKPGDLIGVNKDSYLILDTLPAEYDSRVKAMEVDEKPTEQYTDVGGLDKQIEELVEAIVWPMKEADRFKKIGIKAPKGEKPTSYCLKSCRQLPPLRVLDPVTAVSTRLAIVPLISPPPRCIDVRPSRHWKDAVSKSLCGANRRYIFKTGGTTARPDVHRRWSQAGSRLLCFGKGEGASYHIHR